MTRGQFQKKPMFLGHFAYMFRVFRSSMLPLEGCLVAVWANGRALAIGIAAMPRHHADVMTCFKVLPIDRGHSLAR